MDRDEFLTPEAAAVGALAAAATAVVMTPGVRRVVRRGLVRGLAFVLDLKRQAGQALQGVIVESAGPAAASPAAGAVAEGVAAAAEEAI